MNRRTALTLSMLLGGLVPQSLWAQSSGRKAPKTRDKTFAPVSSRTDDPDDAGARRRSRPARSRRSRAFSGGGTRLPGIPRPPPARPIRKRR